MTYEWKPTSYADPSRALASEGDLDQFLDIPGTKCAAWASIGPSSTGWSYTILDFDADNSAIAHGSAANEAEAKAAVEWWAENIPENYREGTQS